MVEAAAGAAAAGAGAAGPSSLPPITELGAPGGAPADAAGAARFQAAMEKVGGPAAVGDLPPAVQGLFRSLDAINGQARSVTDYASAAEASGNQLTPGEMVQLTMQCQQFMFECQLTSNIANRSSDGVQQLFKQQG